MPAADTTLQVLGAFEPAGYLGRDMVAQALPRIGLPN